MARPDPARRYLMPAITGYEPGTAGTWYHDVTGLAVTYRTHPEAVAALLPDRFTVGTGPGAEALVTVSWASNRGVEPLEYRSAILTHGKTRLFAGRARALR